MGGDGVSGWRPAEAGSVAGPPLLLGLWLSGSAAAVAGAAGPATPTTVTAANAGGGAPSNATAVPGGAPATATATTAAAGEGASTTATAAATAAAAAAGGASDVQLSCFFGRFLSFTGGPTAATAAGATAATAASVASAAPTLRVWQYKQAQSGQLTPWPASGTSYFTQVGEYSLQRGGIDSKGGAEGSLSRPCAKGLGFGGRRRVRAAYGCSYQSSERASHKCKAKCRCRPAVVSSEVRLPTSAVVHNKNSSSHSAVSLLTTLGRPADATILRTACVVGGCERGGLTLVT